MEPRGEYASFGSRFLAVLLDAIILSIVNIIVGFVIGAVVGANSEGPRSGAAIIIAWLYYAYQESSPKQATIGKQAMNIAVTDLNGQRISFARATGRYFGKILSSFILCIGYIMAAFTEKKQALHDMLASTLVVSTKR